MRTNIITTHPQHTADAIFARVRAVTRRRQSRRERLVAVLRDQATPRTIALAGAGLIAAAGLAYATRKLFWQAVGVAADAVEEVADTIEDAAEDLSEAARERTDGGQASG